MKQLLGVDTGSYTFSASAKTITVSGVTLALEQILKIYNATTGTLLYDLEIRELGKTITFASPTITYLGSNTGMNDSDRLLIYIDAPAATTAGGATEVTQLEQANLISKLTRLVDSLLPVVAHLAFDPSTGGVRAQVGNSLVLTTGTARIGAVTANWGDTSGNYPAWYGIGAGLSMDAREVFTEQAHQSWITARNRWTIS